jgi:hypothetical protein
MVFSAEPGDFARFRIVAMVRLRRCAADFTRLTGELSSVNELIRVGAAGRSAFFFGRKFRVAAARSSHVISVAPQTVALSVRKVA